MSIKTLRKRIALVAVSALGAGLMSVVAAPTVNAAATASSYDFNAATSAGICAFGAETNNSTKVGEVLSTGLIAFVEGGSTDNVLANNLNNYLQITVSGPATINAITADSDAAGDAVISYPSANSVRFTNTDATANSNAGNVNLPEAISFRVNGTGTVQISITEQTSSVVSDVEIYTFTASASCLTGSPSVTNSFVRVAFEDTLDSVAEREGTGTPSINTNTTEAAAATGANSTSDREFAKSAALIANGGTAHIGVRIRDVTSSATNVTTQGVFSASATNGAIVAIAVSAGDSSGLALESSTATVVGPTNGSAQQARVYVRQGAVNKDKPLDTVVSVFFNGVLYGTRSIKFTGKATKIEISAADSSISKAENSGKAALVYEITDAAGNKLTSVGTGVSGAASGGDNNSPLLADSMRVESATQAIVTSGSVLTEATGAGAVTVSCGTGSGTAAVTVRYTFADLSSIRSAPYNAACGYTAVNYKASLDKASYQPGEIATLTITATDKNGNPVYDVDSSGDGVDLGESGKNVSISLPQLTPVSAPTNTDEFAGGKKTYKFTVGSTEGSFSGVVDLPLYNGTTYSQVAQTVSYKVASGSTAVTNAEVLSAIVKLIASINKQIRALQKSLRR